VSPHDTRGLYSAALLAPVQRVADSPPWVKAWAMVAVAADVVLGLDLFVLAWFLLFGVTATDYLAGSLRAHWENRHNEDVARAKLLGKAIGLVVTVFLRLGEALLLKAGFNTFGAAALLVTFLLFLEENRSLNRHKKELTGRGIPGLSQMLDAMETVVRRAFPGAAALAPAAAPAPEPDPEP